MNETLKIIQARSSCRNFIDKLPTDEELKAIAQAAIQSPSGMNRQCWQIIVVKNKEIILEMDKEGLQNLKAADNAFYERVVARTGDLFYHAPCMIMIAIKKAEKEGAELVDLGIVAQNIVIAAESLGLASLHCGLAGFSFAGSRAEDFKKKLSFPPEYECGLAVLLGHAKEKRAPREPDQGKITYIQ